jgi:caa(3)-type oxidase subunit IV
MSADNPPIGYVTIWTWLMTLLVIGVAVIAMPFSHTLAIVLLFSVATVKAFLVLRHYMHVRMQPLMIYVMIGVPLLLAIALTFVLMPDIAFHTRPGSPPAAHDASH